MQVLRLRLAKARAFAQDDNSVVGEVVDAVTGKVAGELAGEVLHGECGELAAFGF